MCPASAVFSPSAVRSLAPTVSPSCFPKRDACRFPFPTTHTARSAGNVATSASRFTSMTCVGVSHPFSSARHAASSSLARPDGRMARTFGSPKSCPIDGGISLESSLRKTSNCGSAARPSGSASVRTSKEASRPSSFTTCRTVPVAVTTATGTSSANGASCWACRSVPVTVQPAPAFAVVARPSASSAAPARVTQGSKKPASGLPETASAVRRKSSNVARLPRRSA
ncbi:MAG: hypothetical protein IPF66_01815 [Holophagales bacterium]|nr:hypothetical protein [Holophagales bacterium]